MRQTEYRRRNTALTEEIFEELQKVSQDELNWLFRQIRYKVRRLDGQRMKVTTGSPRLQKSYVVSGNLWDFFVQRMRRAVTKAIVKGAIKLAALQRNHFLSFKPVEFDPEEFAKFIEPEIGERIVGVTKTIKRQVGAKVVGWYNSPGTTMQSLVDQLKPTFGEKRARLIAQTEVTRLNSEVKRLTAEQIGATEWWWSTRRDNLVCVKPLKGPDGKVYKGCRELHGKTFDIGYLMPPDGSHPGCRCDPVLVPPRRTATAQTRPVIEGLLKFDENQPRDEEGKWTDTGKGGGKAIPKYKIKLRDWGGEADANRSGEIGINTKKWGELTPRTQKYVVAHEIIHQTVEEEMLKEYMKNPAYMDEVAEMLTIQMNESGQRWFAGGNSRLNEAVADMMAARIVGDKVPLVKPEAYDWVDETIERFGYTKEGIGEAVNQTLADIQGEIDFEAGGREGGGKAEEWIEGKVDDKSTEQLTLKTVADDDEKYEIPMPAIDNESRTAAKSYLASLSSDEKEAQYKTEELNISDLHSGQPSVRKETVDYFLNGGKPGWLEEFIRVARVNGKLYLMNGNHRVVASMLQGAERVKAKVIDIPALTKADFVESEHPRDEDGKFTDKGMGASGGSEPAYKQTERYKAFTAAIERYHNETGDDERYEALQDAEDAADSYRIGSQTIAKEMREDYFDGDIPIFVTGYIKKGAEGDGYYGNVIFYTDFNKAKASLQSGETLTAFDVEARVVIPVDKQDKTCMSDGMYFRDNRDVDLNYEPPKEAPVKYKLADTEYNENTNKVFNYEKLPEAVKKYNDNHPGAEMTPTEYVEQCEKRLKGIIEDTDVCVRLPVANLNKVLEQGSYKSVFEALKSQAGGFAGGAENKERYLNHRRRAENEMFGIPVEQSTDRPVYGYLAGKGSVHPNSEDLEQYGNVALVLKESVRERTTFTQGDSLDEVYAKGIYSYILPNGYRIKAGKGAPSKMTDPKVQSLTYLEYWSGRDWLTNAEMYEENPEEDNNAVPQKERKYGYWEAQITGGFSVDDIASVTFVGKAAGSKTTKALDKLGIPWKVVEGYVEKMLKADQPNGVLIARNDYLALYALDDQTGYVVNSETGKRYPTHSLASILSRGYWEMREMVEDEDLEKWDEQKHPRDEDGKFTDKGMGVSGGGQESKRFEWTRDPEVTMEQSLSYLKDYVDNKMPDHLKGKSAAKHIEVFDNPEDVYTRLEELGIAPDIGDDGVVRGAYDFESHTIYTSLWDGYRNSEKNFLHEFGHSIFGEDEDKIEAFVEDYYNEPDDRSNEEGGQEPSSDVVLGESLRFKVHDDSGELPEAQIIPYYTNREEVERDFAKHEQNYAKKLTSEEKYALVEYTDVGADWNDLLRGGDGIEPGDELPEESIRLLDAALEKASFPKRASVTRWLSVENPAFEQLEQLKGKIIQDAGFLSTSLESDSYKPMMEHLMEGSLLPGQSEEEYGMSCVNMRINIPKGAHAGLLQGVGEVWSSSEVLLQRNAKLRVRQVYEITNENYKIGKFPTKQIVLDLIP